MNMVLIRHGKAEKSKPDLEDKKRALTLKGKKQVLESAQGLVRLISNNKDIVIVASPARRSIQTAQILSKVIEKYHPCKNVRDEHLYQYDVREATGWMGLMKWSADSCLIMVGHQPQLGMWLEQICGYNIVFKKSAMACIDLDTISPLKGQLAWYMNPEALSRI